MNTTDDGQPVGEDVPVGWMRIGTEHLHSPVAKLIVEADKLTAQTQALAEIREAHTVYLGWLGSGFESDAAEGFIAKVAAILERHGLT